MLNESTFGIQD